jgi:hypothetical protein
MHPKEDTDHLFALVEHINELKDNLDLDVAQGAEDAEMMLVFKFAPDETKRN